MPVYQLYTEKNGERFRKNAHRFLENAERFWAYMAASHAGTAILYTRVAVLSMGRPKW